jgi:hypothetical protein
MSDNQIAENKAVIDSDIKKAKEIASKEGMGIVLPKGGFGTGLAALATKAPQTFAYLNQRLEEEFGFNNTTGEITPTVSTEVKTLQDIENQAIAVIKSTKGDDKYIFLNSQKNLFGNDLVSDNKQGQRLKGKNYKGIDIVADYFTSKTIKDKSGNDTVDILFVDSKEDAQKQFDNYIKGGAKQFSKIEFKPTTEVKPPENPNYDPNNEPTCPF